GWPRWTPAIRSRRDLPRSIRSITGIPDAGTVHGHARPVPAAHGVRVASSPNPGAKALVCKEAVRERLAINGERGDALANRRPAHRACGRGPRAGRPAEGMGPPVRG